MSGLVEASAASGIDQVPVKNLLLCPACAALTFEIAVGTVRHVA